MAKIICILILSTLLSPTIKSQDKNTSFQDKLYSYYINEQPQSWLTVLNENSKNYKANNESNLYDLVNGYYGLIAYYIKIDKNDLAENLLDKAEPFVNKLVTIAPSNNQYKAYEAAFIAFKMEFNPWKIMTLGAKSKEILDAAILKGDTIPEVCFEWANMKYFAPGFAGGDKNEAMTYYKKAYLLFETKNQTKNWYYLYAKLRYADACVEMDKTTEAKNKYQELLRSEPKFKAARKELATLK